MATALQSPHRLAQDAPSGFQEKHQIWLQLQRESDRSGPPKFSHRLAMTLSEEADRLPGRVEGTAWSRFMTGEELVADLDIRIREDSAVTVETFGDDLSWSLAVDAVMTLESRTALYGELRYWDGVQWLEREDFGANACGRIRFKAKKSNAANMERHKFSYNVILRDSNGARVEFEIDPDIKNPST